MMSRTNEMNIQIIWEGKWVRVEMRQDWHMLITVETGCWVPEGSSLGLILYMF